MSKLSEFISSHKLISIIIIIALFFGLMILFASFRGGSGSNNQQENETEEVVVSDTVGSNMNLDSAEDKLQNKKYTELVAAQDKLVARFGEVPDGYIWDYDGSLFSVGDPSLSAEEVLYMYFNGLSNLDMSTVQKCSRKSLVVQRYSSFYDVQSGARNNDYYDKFMRNLYRDCLLSMKVGEVVNNTVFTNDKQVFTINVEMLDLSYKDFWEADKDTIYNNLKIYGSSQDDKTKANMYLYDYITSYFEGANPAKKTVQFDITLQKYPDLNSGWLVSIDTDVDAACRYADGTQIVNYIKNEYAAEGSKYFENKKKAEEESKAQQQAEEEARLKEQQRIQALQDAGYGVIDQNGVYRPFKGNENIYEVPTGEGGN